MENQDNRFITLFQLILGFTSAIAITIVSAYAMFPTKEQVEMELTLRSARRDDQMNEVRRDLRDMKDELKSLDTYLRNRK